MENWHKMEKMWKVMSGTVGQLFSKLTAVVASPAAGVQNHHKMVIDRKTIEKTWKYMDKVSWNLLNFDQVSPTKIWSINELSLFQVRNYDKIFGVQNHHEYIHGQENHRINIDVHTWAS